MMPRSQGTHARISPLCVFCFSLVLLTAFAPVRASAQSIYENTIYSFGGNGDGTTPEGGLIADSEGNMYGVTEHGGAYGAGTVFELVNNSGKYSEQILYSFNPATQLGGGQDGHFPLAGLIMDNHGNLFGTTAAGGGSAPAVAQGTVFELVYQSPGNYSEQNLHIFSSVDGCSPQASLIMDSSGNLYGTTYGNCTTGGPNVGGTVFELVNNGPAGYSYKGLYVFSAVSPLDGRNPSGLVMDSSGNLYGTTIVGGASAKGTVFELAEDSSGNYSEKILYSFLNSGGDGANPRAGLIMDSSGNLYGTTYGGGSGLGTVFELSPAGSSGYSESILYSFSNLMTGDAGPDSGLILDSQGNVYGTTYGIGGPSAVFELVNNSGTYSEQILHTFSPGEGTLPGTLIESANGIFYGVLSAGGLNNYGSIFEVAIVPSGTTYSTTTSLSYSPDPFSGKTITFTALVQSAGTELVPTGTVSFYSASALVGTSSLVSGVATLQAGALEGSTFTITAQFIPSSAFAGSSGQATVIGSDIAVTNGSNTFTGNQTVNGTLSATTFTGNGAGLSNVMAAGLACAGCITNSQLGINYAAGDAQGGNAVTALNALALNGIPSTAFAITGTGGNTFAGPQIINGTITANGALSGTSASFSGPFSSASLALAPAGQATASQGFNSGALDSGASLFNSITGIAQNLLFRWQAEPVASSNNTANPAATLNLLYDASGPASETGLSVNANGTINWAAGQTFPGSGAGSITGITAGTGLTGGGTSGTVTLNLASNTCGAGSALTALPFACSSFAGVGANSFTGSQNVAGTVTATAFSGDGSALTGVKAVSAATATTATSATTAATATAAISATTAATATNALALGGNAPSFYAITGANTFTANQTMPGLTVSGATTSGSISVSGAATSGSIAIGGGTSLKEVLSVTDSVTLPAIPGGMCTTFTTAALTGYTPGSSDTVALGLPAALVSRFPAGVFLTYQAWETTTTASPTITIQACAFGKPYKGGNTGTIRIDIIKH